jgi:hypothetical protein
MKTKKYRLVTLVLCMIFTILGPSIAVASSWIVFPFDDTELKITPSTQTEEQNLNELYGTELSAGELLRKVFPNFVPYLKPEQLEQLDKTLVDWSKYHYFKGNDDVSSNYILNQLGITQYPLDSSSAPREYISRAEFAKIAVYLAGKQALVKEMESADSIFLDVESEDWFNGYVNVIVAEGIMNGDPSGNFLPRDEIKQSEVVTVLLRILGYNDNLPGQWPADYISMAANLGMLDNITFISCDGATCEQVFILCDTALKQYLVEYNDSTKSFEKVLKIESDFIKDSDWQKQIPLTLNRAIFNTI